MNRTIQPGDIDMTPEEALKVLDEVAGRAQMDRAGHVTVQAAVKVLNDVIHPTSKKEPSEDSNEPEVPYKKITRTGRKKKTSKVIKRRRPIVDKPEED